MTSKRLGLAFLLCSAVFTWNGEANELKTFLNRYCLRCHGPDTQEADIRFDSIPVNPNESQKTRWHDIWRQVNEQLMPPEDEAQPPERDRTRFLELIAERYGGPPSSDARDHWSFQPLSRTPIPQSESGVTTPIDYFVQRKLHATGLTLSSPADRRTLIRRASLDLTGLPPSLDEVDMFLHDTSPTSEAFARVVDRLLASERYGERWAQHWLDVIRFAETVGFETNLERTNAWHYRDWVIKALNDDMPYDQFLFEQLAGDTTGTDAALGFLVAGPANLPGQIGRDEEAMRQARQDELDEVVRTVSQAFFGLTIGCARCHDHKFDPISQRDYYSMQAVFAGLSYGHRRLRGDTNDAWTAELPRARRELEVLTRQLEQFRHRHRLRPALSTVTVETFQPILADAIRMEITASTTGSASLYELEIHTVATSDQPSTNVALSSAGAIASASSFALENQTRHHDNLIDGSTDRRQAFPWVAARPGRAWVQIDLARPSNISKVRWHSGRSTPTSYQLKARDAETREWRDVAHTDDRLPMTADHREARDMQLLGVSRDEVARLVTLLEKIRSKQAEVAKLGRRTSNLRGSLF